MKKVEQIKSLIESAFEPFTDKPILVASREIHGDLHTEWVIVSPISSQVIAVFCLSTTCLYKIKYIDASYLPELAKLKKAISNREENQ